MRQLGMLFVALLATTTTWADFGDYRGHELNDDTLVITSTLGELRITAVDDAAFEVHYVEDGVKQTTVRPGRNLATYRAVVPDSERTTINLALSETFTRLPEDEIILW